MFPFERLHVWRRAHVVAVKIHATTVSWSDPDLRGQMRRCAISVAANIAEGAGSDSELHFARYVGIARASAAELRYHLIYARDVGYVSADAYAALDDELDQIRRMLTVLARTIRTNAAHRRG